MNRTAIVSMLMLVALSASAAEEKTYKGIEASQWVQTASDTDRETRLESLRALVAIGSGANVQKIAPKIEPLLTDKDEYTKILAVRWFAITLKDPRVEKICIQMMRDGIDDGMTAQVAYALKEMGPKAKTSLLYLYKIRERHEKIKVGWDKKIRQLENLGDNEDTHYPSLAYPAVLEAIKAIEAKEQP